MKSQLFVAFLFLKGCWRADCCALCIANHLRTPKWTFNLKGNDFVLPESLDIPIQSSETLLSVDKLKEAIRCQSPNIESVLNQHQQQETIKGHQYQQAAENQKQNTKQVLIQEDCNQQQQIYQIFQQDTGCLSRTQSILTQHQQQQGIIHQLFKQEFFTSSPEETSNEESRIKDVMLGSIRWYKTALSPIMPPNCRFLPSCSTYAIESIQKYGSSK
jgi:hypothetical protein